MPGCLKVAGPDLILVKTSYLRMPQEMQAFGTPQVVTAMTLCITHEAQFRELGWLDERDKENGHL